MAVGGRSSILIVGPIQSWYRGDAEADDSKGAMDEAAMEVEICDECTVTYLSVESES